MWFLQYLRTLRLEMVVVVAMGLYTQIGTLALQAGLTKEWPLPHVMLW